MIIAAAILGNDNQIYTGKRHCFIINSNKKGLFKGKNCIQGFITNSGEFLDRQDAAIYALKIGQIKELKFNNVDLFSEDLW